MTSEERHDRADENLALACKEACERFAEHLELACAAQRRWPQRVKAAIAAALDLLVADPRLARLIVIDSLASRETIAHRQRLLRRLAAQLREGRDQGAELAELPAVLEQGLIGGVAGVIAERLVRERAAALPPLLPELTELVLAPYLGPAQAERVARSG